MKISEAISDTADIDVEFSGATLHVTYRPLTYTVAELEDLDRDKKNVKRVVETIRRLVVSWDLTDDDGAVIPIEAPTEDDQPDPLKDVPINIFNAITRKVGEHQSAVNEGKASAAS